MGDRDDAKLGVWRGVATHMLQNASLQSGHLVGEPRGEARRFCAAGDRSERANYTARARQADNRRYVSGKITRTGRKFGRPVVELAEWPPTGCGDARNV